MQSKTENRKVTKEFDFTMPVNEGKHRHGELKVEYYWEWKPGYEKPETSIVGIYYITKDTLGNKIQSGDLHPVFKFINEGEFDCDSIQDAVANDAMWRLMGMSRDTTPYSATNRIYRKREDERDLTTDNKQLPDIFNSIASLVKPHA